MPGEALSEVGHGGEQMLAVVQDQKRFPVGQRLDEDLVDAPARHLGDAGGLGDSPGDRPGLRQRRQLHHPGTIGEAVHDIERDLDGQPGLADAAQSDDADDASVLSSEARAVRSSVRPTKLARSERQVVNDDTDQAQRWESAANVWVIELEQALGLSESAQLERSERERRRSDRQPTLDGGRRGLREQDLATVCPSTDPGCLMHGEVDVVVSGGYGLTGV